MKVTGFKRKSDIFELSRPMVKENRGSGNEVGSGFPEVNDTCKGLNFDIIKIKLAISP